ncbi:MAG: flagellar hook assembly protein FlgD [Treponema sp.]|jgi:flagellar basal-body rod modification protein FlgD|nr:flagellar hook assembly protein FlgD [Treponema sp.]
MTLQSVLSAEDKTELNRIVNEHNTGLNNGRKTQHNLGKDDFIKILVTQLAHQDPTAPMEDKEFIAQIAQFSSLEQMTNMASDFARLANMLTNSEAASALGKSVELTEGENVVQGTVKAVTRDVEPLILVNGTYYNWKQVTKVFEE